MFLFKMGLRSAHRCRLTEFSDSDRKKNQFDSKQIIQILQTIIMDFRLIFCLQLVLMAGAGFSYIPGKYENVVFIIKNPQNRNECFQKQLLDHTK